MKCYQFNIRDKAHTLELKQNTYNTYNKGIGLAKFGNVEVGQQH